jgi:hypothetical protein
MRMEWLRASDNFSACWACFLVYDDRVDVLAITGSRQRIDHSMSPAEARALWADLCECGWHHASEQEVTQHQMSHRKLRSIVYSVNLDRLRTPCGGVVSQGCRTSIAIADTARTCLFSECGLGAKILILWRARRDSNS